MDIKHLAEFVALAETGNYLETADNLFISQSTLSKHIMALEKELGVSLFERTTRKIHLSTEGETFLPYALKIVRLQEEAANVLSAHSKAATNRIAQEIEELTGIETRICVPGHMQRGGSPSPYDRVLATQFGSYAAKMVEDGNFGITVAMKNNHVGENKLADIAGKSRLVPDGHGMLEVARRMGISVG